MGNITQEDRIVIKALRGEKRWSCRRFLKEYTGKALSKTSLDRLIKNWCWITS